jgi:ATP-binding cassette subfamily G (WHITE) protein 2 (PDR)
MYRLSPLTYIIGGLSATGLSGRPVVCSETELNVFQPPNDQTCGQYLSAYLSTAPGQLINPEALINCSYCPLSNANQFLATSGIAWDQRWRNFGFVWAYIIFNIAMAIFLYYVFRVSKWKPASLAQRKKRWNRVGNWFRWGGIWVQVLIMGTIGVMFSREQNNGVSHVEWDDQEMW